MEDFQVINEYLMIRLPAELDHHLAQYFCQKADEYLLNPCIRHIVFDFERTSFMDSSGVGMIMGRYRKVNRLGGKIYILHGGSHILRIFRISGMEKYINVVKEEKCKEIAE